MSDPQDAVSPLVDWLRAIAAPSKTGIDINVTVVSGPTVDMLARVSQRVEDLITQAVTLSTTLAQRMDQAMASIADLQSKADTLRTSVESETSVTQSVVALLQGTNQTIADLRTQLADAIAANDPAALQAVVDTIDAITATNEQNAQALAAAAAANTPAA